MMRLCYVVEPKKARDLNVSGRQAKGIYFAVDFLKSVTQDLLNQSPLRIDAKGKHVVVVGGGDTGNDCIGTCIRQGCASVTQLEMMPCPPSSKHTSLANVAR